MDGRENSNEKLIASQQILFWFFDSHNTDLFVSLNE